MRHRSGRLAASVHCDLSYVVLLSARCRLLLFSSPKLCRMRMLWSRVDLELAQHLSAERIVRQHAANGVLDDAFGVFCQHLAEGDRLQSARVRRVAVIHPLLGLVARQPNVAG